MHTMQSLSLHESKTIRHIIVLCLLLMMILFGCRQVYIKQRKFMPGGRRSKITFQEKVEAAYTAVSPCLTLADNFKPVHVTYHRDLEAHYRALLNITAQFRGMPPHHGSGFNGPWIENLFIKQFIDKPFEFFNGILPLFVQWSDVNLAHHTTDGKSEVDTFRPLLDMLRDDVLYMVVSQANYGLKFLTAVRPNVLIMNSGGEGNVPIPLIKGEIPYQPITPSFPLYEVGFFGSIDHGHRKMLLDRFTKLLDETVPHFRVKMGPSKTWINDMALTMFNLAPVGMGRATFRLQEIIQIGRIPVYLYEDYPWLPYEGSGYSPADLGYIVKGDHFSDVVQAMKKVTNQTLIEKLKRIKEGRSLYTYDGLLNQIEKWFRDPFGPDGGYLRCKRDDRQAKIQAAVGNLHH